jgi:cytidine diphosphoramidate kinase
MVVWITGLAGSGKSTVGHLVYSDWKKTDPATVFVDGDEIRDVFRHNRGDEPYSLEGRRQNAERIASLCAWLDRQNINVVCCILSIFEETRNWNRENYKEYLEVYLHAPEDVLASRRHLYNEAKEGKIKNVVGVDIPFTPPENPDMVFESGPEGDSAEGIAQSVCDQIRQQLGK